MARTAPRVHTAQLEIEHLKALQLALDAELVVALRMKDGRVITGTVTERPAVQQFRGPQEEEGTNGQVPIDVPGEGVQLLWLDEIEDFTRLGSN
ncbi:DUF3247 family protein [Stenotrophomonas sp. STM01]|jgi:hypothetical protein|uniref:DUF3247 family protein n=1 Tax=unclassified Stenotrophomonas TaxID=196198 RepID=UPI00177CD3FD|nr:MULTISPECIES: DUF3247 family protein [unclassified Stenotrophomonas]MBD9534274.1 DUF3247 family protein [Stenotrophomonas sp. STM01]